MKKYLISTIILASFTASSCFGMERALENPFSEVASTAQTRVHNMDDRYHIADSTVKCIIQFDASMSVENLQWSPVIQFFSWSGVK